MNRGIYSLASGMVASQQAMDVLTNNLANVSTTGFKRDQVLFNDAMEQALTNSAGAQLGRLGSGATIKDHFTDDTQGSITTTNNSMDVAIQGKGMFAVQGPNGQILYTRNGAFTTGANGALVTDQGYPVLDNSLKPIQLRPGPMTLSSDGSISAGVDGQPYAKLGVFDGTYTKGTRGLYASSNAAAVRPGNGTTQVKQGALESSNVNAIGSMVDMMSLSRNFDLAQKSIQSEDDMTQKLTTTLS